MELMNISHYKWCAMPRNDMIKMHLDDFRFLIPIELFKSRILYLEIFTTMWQWIKKMRIHIIETLKGKFNNTNQQEPKLKMCDSDGHCKLQRQVGWLLGTLGKHLSTTITKSKLFNFESMSLISFHFEEIIMVLL